MRQNAHSAGCWRADAWQHVVVTVAAGFVLLVSGCRIPQLCGPDSSLVVPADYLGVTGAGNSGQISINEFFDDPALTQLLVEGLAQNQELKIRNQEIQIASNEILARRGAYLPFVSLGTRSGFERTSKFTPMGAAEEQLTAPGGRRFNDPLTNTRISADLVWHVDIWKQYRNAQAAAMQRYCEAIEARNYLITRIVAEIAENYYELAALDKRLVYLEQTIDIQQKSLEVAKAQKEAARGTELGVQRFLAEVRKNESQRLIIRQRIIETENRINFLVGRYPQAVERRAWDFIKLDSQILQVGVPAELLQNRRDIVAAEYEVAASGLDVQVAKANFYPKLDITASVGFEAFNPRYLFDPGAFIAGTAGELVAPLINKKAIQAEYMNANARQLQAIYAYQRTVLNAFTEVVNRMNKVENYRGSVTVKLEQVKALEQSVDVATNLFQGARPEVEYVDVLFAQRDLLEARIDMIETKQQQLSAIVNAYQALGGGYLFMEQVLGPDDISLPLPEPESDDAPGQRALPPTPAGTARLNDDSRTEDDVEWVPVVRKEIAPVEEPDNPALASE
ncbi:MAG TPA: TolC family protein [Planctomycetaceae bacterium]|nr:TolC family protein [Planctomycetaceae bacterium]